jgi:hypothetical protein
VLLRVRMTANEPYNQDLSSDALLIEMGELITIFRGSKREIKKPGRPRFLSNYSAIITGLFFSIFFLFFKGNRIGNKIGITIDTPSICEPRKEDNGISFFHILFYASLSKMFGQTFFCLHLNTLIHHNPLHFPIELIKCF